MNNDANVYLSKTSLTCVSRRALVNMCTHFHAISVKKVECTSNLDQSMMSTSVEGDFQSRKSTISSGMDVPRSKYTIGSIKVSILLTKFINTIKKNSKQAWSKVEPTLKYSILGS